MKQIKELFFQLIPVAVGVYLGILAGNCNENRMHQNQQNELLKNISLELKSNKEKLDVAYAYHMEIGEVADSILNNSPKEKLEQRFFENEGFFGIPGWRGVMIPPLEQSVFDSGIISNLMSGMDFKSLNKISKTYNQQKQYKEYCQVITQKFISTDVNVTTRFILNDLLILKYDILSMEGHLIKNIEEVIQYLEENE